MKKNKEFVKRNITLTPEINDRLDTLVKKTGIRPCRFVERALEDYLTPERVKKFIEAFKTD